jgi:hypothetical protein
MSYLFNDLVGFKADAIDGFNRLRVSEPFTLFDSQHRYQENDKWSTITATGGTHSFNANESVINMQIGLTAGSKVYRETKRVFAYQPGKSLLVLNTFAMNQPHQNLRQRVGYFGEKNGVYFEQDGLTAYITLRSNVTGTVDSTTRRIPQSSWNSDTFDGNGASGRVLSVTGANIFWIDVEWLGVGDVRTGFFVDGKPVIAHTFHNDNLNTTTYMTTATLPIRYELESIGTGVTGTVNGQGITGATMKQICSSVMSEAGYQGFSRRYNVSTDGNPRTGISLTQLIPIISIRLSQDRLDSVIVPSNISALITSSNQAAGTRAVEYRVVLNPGLSGASWQKHYNGNVEYDLSATSITATGNDIIGGFFDQTGVLDISSVNDFNFQLGRTQTSITGATGTSDVFTLLMRAFQTQTDVSADLSWFEII